MFDSATRPSATMMAVAALLALTLTACGGGGGDGGPPPTGGQTSTDTGGGGGGGGTDTDGGTDTGGGSTELNTVIVRSLTQQTAANTAYSIEATEPGTVVLTLPSNNDLQAGNLVRITGVSANAWTVAQNAGQYIDTSTLDGNTPPGQAWTPRLEPRVWHSLSSDASGEILLAGEAAGGRLHTSTDGGASWTSDTSPTGIWIASDMSADGGTMIAAQYFGNLHTSTDQGQTWEAVTNSPLVTGGLAFEGVTVSADGQHIAAVIQNGRIVYSNDGGAQWSAGSSNGTELNNIFWRAIDSSADGQRLVAVSHNGEVYRSVDGGAEWTALSVVVGGTQFTESWYRVKMSADGQTIAVAANSFGLDSGTGIFVSRDGGDTWERAFELAGDYSSLAMSADGSTLGATLAPSPGSTTTVSRVILSRNGGPFEEISPVAGETNWRAMAMSADGNKLAAAAGDFSGGNFAAPESGLLYTSQGNRTSVGLAGGITGGTDEMLELRYEGNGRFSIPASTGTFEVR